MEALRNERSVYPSLLECLASCTDLPTSNHRSNSLFSAEPAAVVPLVVPITCASKTRAPYRAVATSSASAVIPRTPRTAPTAERTRCALRSCLASSASLLAATVPALRTAAAVLARQTSSSSRARSRIARFIRRTLRFLASAPYRHKSDLAKLPSHCSSQASTIRLPSPPISPCS